MSEDQTTGLDLTVWTRPSPLRQIPNENSTAARRTCPVILIRAVTRWPRIEMLNGTLELYSALEGFESSGSRRSNEATDPRALGFCPETSYQETKLRARAREGE
jgi:hypothetical protein